MLIAQDSKLNLGNFDFLVIFRIFFHFWTLAQNEPVINFPAREYYTFY